MSLPQPSCPVVLRYWILLVMVVAVGSGVGAAEKVGEWPQFRGVGGRGVSEASGLPVTWSGGITVGGGGEGVVGSGEPPQAAPETVAPRMSAPRSPRRRRGVLPRSRRGRSSVAGELGAEGQTPARCARCGVMGGGVSKSPGPGRKPARGGRKSA